MEQLPKLIVRGNFFTQYQNFSQDIKDRINQDIEELEKDPDIKRHLMDTAKVFSRTIEGEYKDNLETGKQDGRIPLWKALIVAEVQKISFPTHKDKIRWCSGFMNRYIQQTLSENKRKGKCKTFKYSDKLSKIIEQAASDIIDVDLSRIKTESEKHQILKKFIDKNFKRFNVEMSGTEVIIKKDFNIEITINRKDWVMHQDMDINDSKRWLPAKDESIKKIDEKDSIEKLKSETDEKYNFIIDSLLDDEGIMKGKQELSPNIITNFLNRNGIECKKSEGKRIYNKIVTKMIDLGLDTRLIDKLR